MTTVDANRSEVEFFEGKDHYFYWRLKAGNHEIVTSSEGYTRAEDAVRGFRTMAECASQALIDHLSQ
jgi:uncharacterized protein YegP (UPF0339 family)